MINSTTEMTFRLSNLNREQERISYQMSTGKELQNGSDNSKLYAREVYVEDKIHLYTGIKTQIERTSAQNSSADSTMSEVKKLLTYAKAELIKANTDTVDSTAREAIATNLEGVKKNLFSLANESMEGEYLFAGSNTTIEPFSMDSDGNVTYNGDGYLRSIAVEEGEYRDRGIHGFDAMMYSSDTAYKGDTLEFTSQERIIDQDGNEWKLTTPPVDALDIGVLTKYDKDGFMTEDTMEVIITADATETSPAAYRTREPIAEDGMVLEAKHNIFNDFDNAINALRGLKSDGSATSGKEETLELIGEGVSNMDSAFNGANLGHAKLGGRNQVFEISLDRVYSKLTQFNVLQQDISSADLSKVAIEAKALEMTFTAMYSTINKMSQLSLVNFIK